MWINFTFHHTPDVEKSEIPFIKCTIMVFCCILRCFVAKGLVFCDLRCFSQLQFTRYCVEKMLAQISDRGEKMTNIRYVSVGQIHI